jgi:hypothetical protein
MELIWGVLVLCGVWLGYKMGLGEKLDIQLPEKLKAIIRDDEAQAAKEIELEAKSRKREK